MANKRRHINVGDEYNNPTTHGGMSGRDSIILAKGPDYIKTLSIGMDFSELEKAARKQMAYSAAYIAGLDRHYYKNGIAIPIKMDRTKFV